MESVRCVWNWALPPDTSLIAEKGRRGKNAEAKTAQNKKDYAVLNLLILASLFFVYVVGIVGAVRARLMIAHAEPLH